MARYSRVQQDLEAGGVISDYGGDKADYAYAFAEREVRYVLWGCVARQGRLAKVWKVGEIEVQRICLPIYQLLHMCNKLYGEGA